jgi:hypothetical protein
MPCFPLPPATVSDCLSDSAPGYLPGSIVFAGWKATEERISASGSAHHVGNRRKIINRIKQAEKNVDNGSMSDYFSLVSNFF